jgi:hypothetical protein
MKDFFDEMMEGVVEIQSDKDNGPDFEGSFNAGECPFCGNEEFIIGIKKTPQGKQFLHFCPLCTKSWVVEIDPDDGRVVTWELDLKNPPDM